MTGWMRRAAEVADSLGVPPDDYHTRAFIARHLPVYAPEYRDTSIQPRAKEPRQ